ncbi:MAG: mechanosensitive ion channel [Gammaproteobacteria bacterium]|nr:mechanosensitive ion channel [Gammaproteobacteria bacterium]MBL6999563.1 mechanosensitive ion channel [Gammaproteobacteria bacterium]
MLDKLDKLDLIKLMDTYVIPWGINIVMALAIFFIGKIIVNTLSQLLGKVLRKSKMDNILVNFITSIIRTILLLFVVIAALDRLGLDTTSLIALLGAAGLAVGLALQGSLQNFASGVMLIIFRPFKAGDFVEVAGTSGVVETISIFSSILRTGDNREIIIPNGSIYGGTITNFSARDTRRIDMTFGIGYDDDIKKAKELLAQIVSQDERVLPEPKTVIALSELASSSVNFVVRPWVKTGDYWAVKWDLTEQVKLQFDQAGISIPYPQMDVHHTAKK